MKTLLIGLAWLWLVTAAQAQGKAGVQHKPVSAADVTSMEQRIMGVWTFVGEPGSVGATDKKVKLILDKHWMFSQPDPTSNIALYHHGGTYALKGNNYAETIEYANESTGGLLGQTFNYEVSMKGDTLSLKGVGNPWSETWKRIR